MSVPLPGPPYKLATDEDFDNFRKECETTSGWDEAYSDASTFVWTKKSDVSVINIVKVQAYFSEADPTILYDVLHDHEYRAVWDENMIEGKVIEQLDKHNEVGYYSAKSPLGISNRDFLNQRSWRATPSKGEWLIINHSVSHPDVPEKKGFVRAQSILTGYYIKKIEGKPGAQFIYMTQSNPNGWIPGWLINQVMSKFAPKLIEKLYQASRKYVEWKNEHKPTEKPWLD